MNTTLLKKALISVFFVYFCLADWAGVTENVLAVSPDEISSFVTVAPPILDFGQVNEAKNHIKLSLTLKNSSNHEINIVSVKTGCGCTTTQLPQSTLKTGTSVSVPVVVNILGRRGKFENNVRIEIAGYKNQIVVPIK